MVALLQVFDFLHSYWFLIHCSDIAANMQRYQPTLCTVRCTIKCWFCCSHVFLCAFVADELETAATDIQSPKILSLEEIKRRKALKEQQQKQEEGEGKDKGPMCMCVCLSVYLSVFWNVGVCSLVLK